MFLVSNILRWKVHMGFETRNQDAGASITSYSCLMLASFVSLICQTQLTIFQTKSCEDQMASWPTKGYRTLSGVFIIITAPAWQLVIWSLGREKKMPVSNRLTNKKLDPDDVFTSTTLILISVPKIDKVRTHKKPMSSQGLYHEFICWILVSLFTMTLS